MIESLSFSPTIPQSAPTPGSNSLLIKLETTEFKSVNNLTYARSKNGACLLNGVASDSAFVEAEEGLCWWVRGIVLAVREVRSRARDRASSVSRGEEDVRLIQPGRSSTTERV